MVDMDEPISLVTSLLRCHPLLGAPHLLDDIPMLTAAAKRLSSARSA